MWDKKYDIVLADPPWSYYGSTTGMGDAAKFYNLISDEEMLKLPIFELLKPTSILFLWATSPRLDFAMRCLRKWKLNYRGIAFVWVKTKKTDPLIPIGAMGVRPSIVKPTTEYVLAASYILKGRPIPLADESIRQVVLSPKRNHSQKPDEVQERIELMYPKATKIELFARVKKPGWDSWGDEV